MNKEQSSVYFSPNTAAPLQHELKQILNINVEAFTERYLGLPTSVGRITSGTFDHIGERIRSKLQGGSERMISCASREVRLKTIAMVIPTFSMSCFKLTKKVYKSISSPMTKY